MPVQFYAESREIAAGLQRRLDKVGMVKTYFRHGLSALTIRERVLLFTHCQAELKDRHIFKAVQAEKNAEWEKNHPYLSKIYRLAEVLSRFSKAHEKLINVSFLTLAVFLYRNVGRI